MEAATRKKKSQLVTSVKKAMRYFHNVLKTIKMVEAFSRLQPFDNTQGNFQRPIKDQVEAVNFDNIAGEKK